MSINSLTTTQFWNTEYDNFNATTDEAKSFLVSIDLTEENKDIKIVNNFFKNENENVGKYHNVWEAKENQYVWLPNIISFQEWKDDQAKKEAQVKADAELAKTIKIGDKIHLSGKHGDYRVVITEIIEGLLVIADNSKYRVYMLGDKLSGIWTR